MPDVTHRPMRPLEWAMLLTLSVLWGGTFFLTHVALHEVPPLTLVALRVGLAALLLNIVLPILGLHLPRSRRVWAAFFAMGVLNNTVPFSLIVWGQTQIASGLAAILNATTPLSTVLVAHVFTADERMTGNRLAGVLIGFAGVALVIGPSILADLSSAVWAELAVLAATVSYACAGVFGRRFAAMGVAPLATATGQVTASTALLVPLVLAVDAPWTGVLPGAPACAAILALAVFSTALAYGLYFRILATAGATNLLLVTFLIPVSALVLGNRVLGEPILARHLGGMVLIACGLVAIDGRLWAGLRRLGRRNPADGRGIP